MKVINPSVECFLAGPGRFSERTREMSLLRSEWVRLRYLYCGVCGSDMSQFENRRAGRVPASMGHEFIAEVVSVGDSVEQVEPGDIVTSDLNYRCGRCEYCVAHKSHLCREGQIGHFSNRAFAQYGDIHASYLLRLDGPPQQHLALSEPLSCVLHAKQWAKLQPDDDILVVGAGGIGLCMAFALRYQPPAQEFDIIDLMSTRLELIERVVAPNGRAISEPQRQYDIVFDVSGSETGLLTACRQVKPGGRLCSMSHLDGYTNAEFLLPVLTRKDVTFIVSYLNGERANLATAADILTANWNPAWDKLLEVLPIGRLQQAFECRRASPWCKTLVHVDSSEWPS